MHWFPTLAEVAARTESRTVVKRMSWLDAILEQFVSNRMRWWS
jgi:hypothetical protein